MTADQLKEELASLEGWTAMPEDRLREALELLRKAHNALDVMEGEVQDLKDDRPSEWAQGVLKVLNGSVYELGTGMEAAKVHCADKYGYASPEYDTMSALAEALDPSGKETY